MSERILQINFKFNVSRAEYEQAVAPLASEIAAVAGLRWKVWLMNEEEKSAGGIYLFKDSASVKDFLNGSIVAAVMSNPALSDIEAKVFGVIVENSKITRGPIE